LYLFVGHKKILNFTKRCQSMNSLLLARRRIEAKIFLTSHYRCNYHKVLKTLDHVRLGDIEIPCGNPKVAHLVPQNYLVKDPSKEMLKHLQWMMSKDILGQDMMLIGPPGVGAIYRRRLALAYAEMTRREVHVVNLSSDTTESDLKQRRELIADSSGSTKVLFVDQPPVEAAIHGRLLILDGLEKVERNVLPTLNNLLENREINLEDGRFLISPRRHTELKSLNSDFLVPVHHDFRVIALGIPAPPFQGNSLDPPLRSRFQTRRVDLPNTDEIYHDLVSKGITESLCQTLAKIAGSINITASQNIDTISYSSRIWNYPSHDLFSRAQLIQIFPEECSQRLLMRAYPIAMQDSSLQTIFGTRLESSQKLFQKASAGLKRRDTNQHYHIADIQRLSATEAEVTFSCATSFFQRANTVSVTVPCGSMDVNASSPTFVLTSSAKEVLSEIMQEHAIGRDVLLLSRRKGEGKNAIANQFSSLLGYEPCIFHLNSEMTVRDLFLRRGTDSKTGETIWDESFLVKSARQGHLCILDGADKLRKDVLSTLKSFIVDRDIFLPDGRRLFANSHIPDITNNEAVVKIHDSFRILALGSISKHSAKDWLSEDVIGMFSTIILPEARDECLRAILKSAFPSCSMELMEPIFRLREKLNEKVAEECGVTPLSIRDIIRVSKQISLSTLYDALSSVFVAELLPQRQRLALDSLLLSVGVKKQTKGRNQATEISILGDALVLGGFTMKRKIARRPEMVPFSHNFIDIPNHVQILQNILQEYQSGARSFLLLGNQGVGKNFIVDRLCQLVQFEREYIQLHRDSTIGQLTLSPTLQDGKIIWNDSPLVRAVTEGCALVIDEADKAPLDVIAVLKGLVEDGELALADGRRISRHSSGPDVIPLHPDFLIFVLANRPGYPFLGNDFFREIGDCFSTKVVPFPSIDSEIQLLHSYAPNVPKSTLEKIANCFADLRELFDQGDINYPYSTREAVSVVKHLSKFPKHNISSILRNILDFDSYNEQNYSTLENIFLKYGIALHPVHEKTVDQSDLSIQYLRRNQEGGESSTPPPLGDPKRGKWDEKNEAHVGGNQWAGGTGGSDTAGLGGRGGPYRLDRGHKVYQVSDESKASISEEAANIARKMAKEALDERLREIQMSNSDWKFYNQFLDRIGNDVSILKDMLGSLDLRHQERGWIKRQSHGELDDSKLVDSVTGEKLVYKRRGFHDSHGTVHAPKLLRFVLDCSGSMYRFNGYDERLFRCLEAALLIMKSFEEMQHRFNYSIVGHSGDSQRIGLVEFDDQPKNEKEYMQILKVMAAHSQFCQSGDHTLDALRLAIQEVIAETKKGELSSQDPIVVLVSDANLSRYGIHPKELSRIIQDGSDQLHSIKVYCIFIASFDREAEEIKNALPLGTAQICLQTSDLPRIVRNLLANIN
jgi:von Willebrand factor A domain-containing protein 8